MKTIAYLTATPIGDPFVFSALSRAADSSGYRVLRTTDDSYTLERDGSPVSLIRSAELVVAHLARESPNVLYEIGIAHGLGKPVLLVTKNARWVPLDLQGQLIVTYELGKDSSEKLTFILTQWLTNLESRNVSDWKLLGLAQATPPLVTGPSEARQHRLPTTQLRGSQFENQVAEVLSQVPGWEITEAEPNRRNAVFDFIVWNQLDDPLLATLGNPIAFEVKGQKPTKEAIERLVRSASTQGLKGLVLITSALLSHYERIAFAKTGSRRGIVALALDERDLASTSPSEIPRKLRQRLIEARAV